MIKLKIHILKNLRDKDKTLLETPPNWEAKLVKANTVKLKLLVHPLNKDVDDANLYKFYWEPCCAGIQSESQQLERTNPS